MSTLISRVRNHTNGQKTSGQNTLSLTVECIDHMFGPSGDWSPLAYLIGKSEPVQSRVVRRIVGKCVQGYRLVKDAEQVSGLRFSKIKDKNQGIDTAQLDRVRALVAGKKSIQGQDVKTLIAGEKTESKEFDPKAWADRMVKAHPSDIDAMIAALQAKRQKASV